MPHDASGPARILWVAFVFPPYGGTQGVWMKKYIEHITGQCKDKVAIDVLTISPSRQYPQYDDSLGVPAGENVRVFRVPPGPFHGLRHRWRADAGGEEDAGRLRRLLTGPVALLGNAVWVAPALAWLLWRRLSSAWGGRDRRGRYVGVYTFVDPIWSLVVGYAAAWLNGASWVAEYGDPWRTKMTTAKKPAAARLLGGLVERLTLPRAKMVATQVESVCESYSELYPAVPRERFETLYGGVEWDEPESEGHVQKDGGFVICHTGILYGESSDPGPFFLALKDLASRGVPVKALFLGAVDPRARQLARGLGLEGRVTFAGHRPYDEAAGHQRSAALLVAFSLNSHYKVPSKISQYIAARRPVLVVTEIDGDPSARLVEENRRGVAVKNTPEAISGAVLEIYELWKTGGLDGRFDFSRMESISYSHIAGRIKDALVPGVSCAAG